MWSVPSLLLRALWAQLIGGLRYRACRQCHGPALPRTQRWGWRAGVTTGTKKPGDKRRGARYISRTAGSIFCARPRTSVVADHQEAAQPYPIGREVIGNG